MRIARLILAMLWATTSVQAQEALQAIRTEGPLTYFKGAVTLQGKVVRRTDDNTLGLMGDLICFEASEGSRKRIPRPPGDSRDAWFCFVDHNAALKLLRLATEPQHGSCGYEASATVRISHYVLNREESEVSDLASLERVIRRGPLRPRPCSGTADR